MMHQISANTRLCRVCIWPRPLSAFSSFPSLWLQWMPQNMWWRQPLKLRKFHEYGCAWKWGRPIPHPTSHLDGNMIHHWILGPWPIFRHTNMTARFLRWQVTLVFSKVVTKRVQQPAIFARFWAPRDGRLCQCVCVSQLHEILPGNGVWHMFWAFQSLIFWMPRPFHSIEFDCGNVVSPCAWDSQRAAGIHDSVSNFRLKGLKTYHLSIIFDIYIMISLKFFKHISYFYIFYIMIHDIYIIFIFIKCYIYINKSVHHSLSTVRYLERCPFWKDPRIWAWPAARSPDRWLLHQRRHARRCWGKKRQCLPASFTRTADICWYQLIDLNIGNTSYFVSYLWLKQRWFPVDVQLVHQTILIAVEAAPIDPLHRQILHHRRHRPRAYKKNIMKMKPGYFNGFPKHSISVSTDMLKTKPGSTDAEQVDLISRPYAIWWDMIALKGLLARHIWSNLPTSPAFIQHHGWSSTIDCREARYFALNVSWENQKNGRFSSHFWLLEATATINIPPQAGSLSSPATKYRTIPMKRILHQDLVFEEVLWKVSLSRNDMELYNQWDTVFDQDTLGNLA